MTSPTNPTDTGAFTAPQPRATSFVDWFHVNSRWVAVGAAAIAVAALVAWYVPHQRTLASENADKLLLAAKQSLASGNPQLAESDLKKVAEKYADTPAGAEAGMLVAQVHLERGDAPGAVTYLQGVVAKIGDGTNASTVRGLLADALAQANKPAEAAAEYERAAAATKYPNERALLLSKAGYAFMTANNTGEARRIFKVLATQQESQAMAAEAKVRLGELDAAAKG
jgi:predicted negative regulator of RcsB-dependent stress response